MSLLNPRMVGAWNAHDLWLQWTPSAEVTPMGYRVEFSVREKLEDKVTWTVVDNGRTTNSWRPISIWKAQAIVQARVSVNGRDAEPETAMECVFTRSTCIFNFQASAKRSLVFDPGSSFHCHVDGAGCSYISLTDIHVPAGETARVTLSALCSSGWNQLDREGDFSLVPEPMARIWNAEESKNDLEPTGRIYTVMTAVPMDGPLALVFMPRTAQVR